MNDQIEQRTCVACGVTYERLAWMTFDQGQCDDCITQWANDKAVRELDAAICTRPQLAVEAAERGDMTSARGHAAILREHQRIHDIWKARR